MAHRIVSLFLRLLALALSCRGSGASSIQPDTRLVAASRAPTAKVDYAGVRARVAHAFAEKAHEMTETVAVLQKLSKDTVALVDTINMHCGVKLETASTAKRPALRG